jgi:hypothetical protein
MPGNAEAPASIEFRGNESRWGALFYVVLGGVLVCWLLSRGDETGVVGSIFIGPLFLLLAISKAVNEPDRSVHLALDEEGLLAPHIFERKLPWSAVQSYSLDLISDDGCALIVSVSELMRYEPKQTDPLATWPVTPSGFRLHLGGVAFTEKDVDAAFRRFAPHVRRL